MRYIPMEEKILDGVFEILPSYTKNKVTLTRQNIIIQLVNKRTPQIPSLTSILIENVIGAKICESIIREDKSNYFKIITLLKNKKGFRYKQIYTFRIENVEDDQESYAIANTWVRTILWLLKDPEINLSELKEKEEFPPRRRFYVMINPKSGKGKSLKIFYEMVDPVFKDANVDTEVLVTEYAGHGKDKAKTLDVQKYNTIVICSGDGLGNEYVNGILERPDGDTAIKVPFSILPTGSGNALAASLMFAADEKPDVLSAVYILLKGKPYPMDLFSIKSTKLNSYGFLSVVWGLIADVDIESEKYRRLGPLRFTIGALQRIISLRHYHGKFMYIPYTKEGNHKSVSNVRKQNSPDNSRKDINEQAYVEDSVSISNNEEKMEDSSNISLSIDESNTVPVSENPNSNATSNSIGNDKHSKNIVKNAISDKDWVTLEDNFVCVCLCAITHLGIGMYSSPTSTFNDEQLKAIVVRKGITKSRLLKLFTAFENGSYIDFPEVEVFDVKEFRIIPDLDRIGHVTLDGENIDYRALEGKVHPSLASVIMRPVFKETSDQASKPTSHLENMSMNHIVVNA